MILMTSSNDTLHPSTEWSQMFHINFVEAVAFVTIVAAVTLVSIVTAITLLSYDAATH